MGFISCEFAGRIANNIFQAAAVYGIGEKHKLTPIFSNCLFSEFFKLPIGNIPYINEHNESDYTFAYHEVPYKDNLYLKGFFQSEKYFKHIRNRIVKIFGSPNKEPIDAISVHIRRTDYTLHNDCFICPTFSDYYDPLIARHPGKKIILFSDDLPFCEKLLKKYPNAEISPGTINHCKASFPRYEQKYANDVEDLWYMSRCKINITAPSSFSWWGAWLNEYENKVVYCHLPYFGPGNSHLDTKDILPEDWLKIVQKKF